MEAHLTDAYFRNIGSLLKYNRRAMPDPPWLETRLGDLVSTEEEALVHQGFCEAWQGLTSEITAEARLTLWRAQGDGAEFARIQN